MAINKKLIATGGDTSIVASDYFKIKLYTGNYSTSRNITGHNFRPALVWIKNRDQNDPHMIYDSTRGVNKFIAFNSGANEASDTNQLLAFLSNGFRILDGSATYNGIDNIKHIYAAFAEQPIKYATAR